LSLLHDDYSRLATFTTPYNGLRLTRRVLPLKQVDRAGGYD